MYTSLYIEETLWEHFCSVTGIVGKVAKKIMEERSQ